MARINIDDKIARDPRVTHLAKLLGWSKRETVGCLVLDVWPVCYDRKTALLGRIDVDLATGVDGFAEHMITAGLAHDTKRGIRIAGVSERIEFLVRQKSLGSRGGKARANRAVGSDRLSDAQNPAKRPSSLPLALDLDLAPDLALAPDLDPKTPIVPKGDVRPLGGTGSDRQPDSPKLAELKRKVDATVGEVGARRARKPKPGAITPDERATAMRVLGKLGERNGVAYTGSEKHVGLIARHLRNGLPEMHLRYVVGYCAVELGWQHDDKMRLYLRPETLFGPETIAKYLDPAVTWANSLPDDKPRLVSVPHQPEDGAA